MYSFRLRQLQWSFLFFQQAKAWETPRLAKSWKTLKLSVVEVGVLFDFARDVGFYFQGNRGKFGRVGGGVYVNVPSLLRAYDELYLRPNAPFNPANRPFWNPPQPGGPPGWGWAY